MRAADCYPHAGEPVEGSGVVDRVSKGRQTNYQYCHAVLGLAIMPIMTAEGLPAPANAGDSVLGALAFILDTVAGLLFGKLMSFVTGGKSTR